MATMLMFPDQGTILANRQKLDFYCWMGIPVCRTWPKKANYTRSAGEVAGSESFTTAAKATGAIDAETRAFFQEMAVGGKGYTWVDLFRATALGSDGFYVIK